MQLRKIGLALSGGGMRATLFHLGVFRWLAEQGAMEQVKCVSTVSGGSLCVGLIFAHNDLQWPSSQEYLTKVLPAIERTLSQNDLQIAALLRLPLSPHYWHRKANLLARTMEKKWGVHGDLAELSTKVAWYVNCTTYETGKRFRFCQKDMGDYTVGYVKNPSIALSEIMAASAGFPVLIGPYRLKVNRYEGQWQPYPLFRKEWEAPKGSLHLWDGGVYDNLGLESVFNPAGGGKPRNRLEYLIVSNASPSLERQERLLGFTYHGVRRLLDISMSQVVALRTRSFMDYITRQHAGMYLKIGNSASEIAESSRCAPELAEELISKCMSCEDADAAMNYPTTLRTPKPDDLRRLIRHGYEVAECTYRCYWDK